MGVVQEKLSFVVESLIGIARSGGAFSSDAIRGLTEILVEIMDSLKGGDQADRS